MKFQKRVKMMVDGIFGTERGDILTKGDFRYTDEHRNGYTTEYIENLGEVLAQSISHDGLTREEMKGKACQFYNEIDKKWYDFQIMDKSVDISLCRLKPEEVYIQVPENIELYTKQYQTNVVVNKRRGLYLHFDDNKPALFPIPQIYKRVPHQIEKETEPGKLENGAIYYSMAAGNGAFDYIGEISFYGVYCKEEGKMYYHSDSYGYGVNYDRVADNETKFFRKVVAVKS